MGLRGRRCRKTPRACTVLAASRPMVRVSVETPAIVSALPKVRAMAERYSGAFEATSCLLTT